LAERNTWWMSCLYPGTAGVYLHRHRRARSLLLP
jgi:hypothetical protein